MKQQSSLKILLFFFMVTVVALPASAAEIFLTIDDAVAVALCDNRDILIRAEEVEKAKAKIAEAKAERLPSLTVSSSGIETIGYYSEDTAQLSFQSSLRQYLYRGGKTVNAIRYNEYGLAISKTLLDTSKLNTILNVKNTFYLLLLAGDLTELNKDILENSMAHLKSLKLRYQNGQASEFDVQEAEAGFENVAQAYQASKHQFEAAQAILNNLLYLAQDTTVKPVFEPGYVETEIEYDEAFLKAMNERPEIRQHELQAKAAEKQVAIAKAESRPAIYASWDYYTRSHTVTGQKEWNDYNVVGVTVSWPVFDGWAAKAKVDQAIVGLKEAKLSEEKISNDISLELKEAYLDFKSAVDKISAAVVGREVYKNNLGAIEAKYKAGIASFLDMHDASLSYKIADFNYKEAVYDYLIAKAKLNKAVGGTDA